MNAGFVSFLADYLVDFVAFRRSLGYTYTTQIYVLRQFDRVVQEQMPHPGPVTREVVEAYLRATSYLRPLTRRVRLSVVRQFLLHVWHMEPDTYVPERSMLPKGARPRPPNIFTDEEIRALMRAALGYPSRYRVYRWSLYHTLIGFLYATGMRISEVLALRLGDVDFEQGLVHIRKTKFHKSRLVPMLPSTCCAVQQYLVERAGRGHPTTASSAVFVASTGGPLPCSTVRHAFRRIVRMAGLRDPAAGRTLRLHDLRHTAAVRRLYLWYCQGRDVNALLPVLVTYLGHSAVRCTETYLTATAELLEEANARFETDFPLDSCHSPPDP
jgi:integrase/recombinase XerD